jgi:trehalose-phosphatase
MPPEERQERMRQMRAHLLQNDIYHWMERHVRTAAQIVAERAATRSVFDDLGTVQQLVASRDHLAVLADFDGTLAQQADRPGDAVLPPLTRAILARMARRPRSLVAVISSRALPELRQRVGVRDIVYVGNQGFEITGPGWASERREASEVRELVAACIQRLRHRLRGVRDAVVEDMGLTASIHHRLVRRDQVEAVHQAVLEELGRVPPGKLVLRRSKMVLEILPAIDWHKGQAAIWLLEHVLGRGWRTRCTVLFAGDDTTDEDAFLALADAGATIRVGTGPYPTAARYMVTDVQEFTRLLGLVSTWVGSPGHRP